MSFRAVVLPLGFGLSAVLWSSAGAPAGDPPPRAKPPVRLYTNEDLDRVRPFRAETGVLSVPAVPPAGRDSPPAADARKARGESYWRREAEGVRDRVQAMQAQDWLFGVAGTWRHDPKLSGGGQLNDSGSHLVDIILWVSGLEPAEAFAYIVNFNRTYGKWLLQKNCVIKINDIVFAHGGINIKFSSWKLEEINPDGN